MAKKKTKAPFKQCPVGTEIQTVIFDKKKFSKAEAKTWAKDHKFKFGKVDASDEYWRMRQRDPNEFDKGSMRTITLTKGVKAVIGCPIDKMAKGGTVSTDDWDTWFDYLVGLAEKGKAKADEALRKLYVIAQKAASKANLNNFEKTAKKVKDAKLKKELAKTVKNIKDGKHKDEFRVTYGGNTAKDKRSSTTNSLFAHYRQAYTYHDEFEDGGEVDEGLEEGSIVIVSPTGEGIKSSSPAANWITEDTEVELMEYAPNQGTLDVIDVLYDGEEQSIYDFNIKSVVSKMAKGGKVSSFWDYYGKYGHILGGRI